MSASPVKLNNQSDVEEINSRIFRRNIPSSNNLKQYPITALSFRATPTKYQTMETSMAQNSKNSIIDINNSLLSTKPVQTFDVNDESYLRNQFFALQSCPQAYCIPDSTSELYNYRVDSNIKPDNVSAQYPHLFREESFGYFNPNPHSSTVGFSVFNNHTRNQMKNIQE